MAGEAMSTDTSKVPKLDLSRMDPRSGWPADHSTDWDGMAYWPAQVDWSQIYRDGSCRVNNEILPPPIQLQKRAQEIVNGLFVKYRHEGDWHSWHDLVEGWPGELDLRGSLRADTGHMEWRISFREAGDPDSYGLSSGFMLPDFAYAWLIAATQEHHLEALAENLLAGGLS